MNLRIKKKRADGHKISKRKKCQLYNKIKDQNKWKGAKNKKVNKKGQRKEPQI